MTKRKSVDDPVLSRDDPPGPGSPDPLRWAALAVLALAQFMVVLDVTIVNVALPDIQQALGFTAEGLQWVINAYALALGGLLLLGGRVADLLGRRRVFISGLALFVGASAVAGVAGSPETLIVARTVQGVGAALLSPAALALLQVAFPAGRERNVAMGVWGALGGLGGTLGVIAGGLLVDAFGWEWIFFVNLPIGLLVALAVPRVLRESRGAHGARTFDLAGALLSTAGVTAIVYGIIRTDQSGWGSAEVLALLLGGLGLLGLFVAVERRSSAPLVPMRLFASRGLSVSSVALALNGAAFLGMFFLTALFLQTVRGDSPLSAGIQFVPMGVAAVLAAVFGGQLVTRVGTRPVLVAGGVLSVIGLLLLTGASATGSYVSDILPGIVVYGAGLSLIGVSAQISAVLQVPHDDVGAASGIVTAAFQIGGAFGLAVITTFANSRVEEVASSGTEQAQALTEGFSRGLVVAAVFAAVNLALGLAAARSVVPDEEALAEAMAAA